MKKINFLKKDRKYHIAVNMSRFIYLLLISCFLNCNSYIKNTNSITKPLSFKTKKNVLKELNDDIDISEKNTIKNNNHYYPLKKISCFSIIFILLFVKLITIENDELSVNNLRILQKSLPPYPKNNTNKINCNNFDNIFNLKDNSEIIQNYIYIKDEIFYCPIIGNKDIEIKPLFNNNIQNLTSNDISEIMHKNSIIKLLFIQDPLERILNNIYNSPELISIKNSAQLLNELSIEIQNKNTSKAGLTPQYLHCDIYKWINEYSIIDLRNDKNLYQLKNYYTKNQDLNIEIFKTNNTKLKTYAINFFNIHHLSFLIEYYGYDYTLFNLPIPEWICDITIKEWKQKLNYTIEELYLLNKNKTKASEKNRQASIFYTDLISLWNSITEYPSSKNLSCLETIENCIFYGNCILDFKANLEIVKSNIFDPSYGQILWKKDYFKKNAIYFNDFKLFFCRIPKNSITMWRTVFLRMLNLNNPEIKWWSTKVSSQTLFDAQKLTKNVSAAEISPNYLASVLNNNSWYKAVFLREPLERILSGTLNKLTKKFKDGNYIKSLIKYLLKYIIDLKRSILEVDMHVSPQYLQCDLFKWIDKYEQFKFENLSHRKLFLQKINLWEIGEDGWNKKQHYKNNNEWMKFENGTKFSVLNFTTPIFSKHATNSKSQVLQYYNVKDISILLYYLKLDYKLLKLDFPEWICDIVTKEWYKLSSINYKEANIFLTELLNLFIKISSLEKAKKLSCFNKVKSCIYNGIC